MRIAEVVAVFPPYPGGTGYVCLHNAKELSRRGHDVTVFTLDYRQEIQSYAVPGVTIERMATPLLWGGGGVVPQLFMRLAEFDVVHLHYPFYGGAEYVLLSALCKGTKYLITYHQDVNPGSILKRMVIRSYELLFLNRILRHASRVAVLSESHARSTRAAGFFDWGKVSQIPNGVDMNVFSPGMADQDLVRRFSLEGKTVVLFVGHLETFKGLHVLLEAMANLDRDDVILIVVGVGSQEAAYRRTVLERGLQNKVIFAGYQDQSRDLPKFYNSCDLLVLPSVGPPESFGMVIIEAMASGLPVIVSALPGPSELVDDGVDGFVVPVGDVLLLKERIQSLVDDTALRKRMGDAAYRKVAERYSWSTIGERLEEAILGIVRSPKSLC